MSTQDQAYLTLLLDRAKAAIFSDPRRGGFYGPLICSINISFDTSIKTACVQGNYMLINPEFFQQINEEERITVILHEIRHIADLHSIRRGSRNPLTWNWACDIHINNTLKMSGYKFESGIEWAWMDPIEGVRYHDAPPEDIYDDLVARGIDASVFNPDMGDDPEDGMAHAHTVIQAVHQAKATGKESHIPDGVESLVNTFLTPVIPWEQELYEFFKDLADNMYRTWGRPNRRIHHINLPSYVSDESKLEHIAYFIDVSGSITHHQVIRVNSEIKYIKEVLKPKKLTIIQFDDRITKVIEVNEEDDFNELEIYGRRGTSLRPVRQWIIDNEPTAAIIFSDLMCTPMQNLPTQIPIIWVAVDNHLATIPFGRIIYIES